jgi:ParB family chromosome partitioning protein
MAQALVKSPRESRSQDRRIIQIPIDSVRTNPYQPRKYFSSENLFELAQSIAQYGLIQPITVRRTRDGGYELIAGERRLRACGLLGWKSIPAIQANAMDQDSAIIAMIENLQRENLHYLEEAEGYLSIIRQMGFSQEEVARRVGKNQCTIANKIRLLKLPMSVKKKVLAHGLVERQARALLRLHDEQLQLEAIALVIEKRMNVKDTESLVERILKNTYQQDDQEPKKKSRISPKMTTLVNDTRLYINSFKDILKKMSSAGFSPEYNTVEAEDHIEIKIVIPLERAPVKK